jgi:hypothetical protein
VRVILSAAILSAILATGPSASRAATARESDAPGASAGIVDGTPVAVAVRGGDGAELGGHARRGGGPGTRWTCSYHPLTAGGNVPGVDYDHAVTPVVGDVYAFLCHDEGGQLVHARVLRHEPGDPLGGLFAAERAAELAVERLPLPDPVVGLSPPAGQLVGVPTWLWVGDWSTRTTSAAVGGVTSTVTARPTSSTWDLGDGTTVGCAGPGTPHDPARPPEGQTTDCAHTYVWPSSHPRGARWLAVTVAYDVSWSATTGAGGDLGAVTRSTTVPIAVSEVQAVGG